MAGGRTMKAESTLLGPDPGRFSGAANSLVDADHSRLHAICDRRCLRTAEDDRTQTVVGVVGALDRLFNRSYSGLSPRPVRMSHPVRAACREKCRR